jgi:hypothetical protein|tara:strand:+ start:13 stop:546 length:534 start_codon:yes stop_codon:yes gene_type:complete
MSYFNQFPLMAYDMAGNQQYKLLPNILKRVKLRSGLRSGSFMFDNYNVKDGEKPEDIAYKWFGDAKYHWVILMTNNITDRYYQWPLTQPQFQEHLEDKYGLANIDAVHHYEKTQDSGVTSSRDHSHLVECNSDDGDPSIISNRQYEQRKQDEYREIRLLDTRYLSTFVEEFETLIKG